MFLSTYVLGEKLSSEHHWVVMIEMSHFHISSKCGDFQTQACRVFFKVGIFLLFALSLDNFYFPLACEHNGGKQMLCMYLRPFYPRYTKEKQIITVQKDRSLPAKASASHHVSALAQKYLLHLPSHNTFLSCFMKSWILFLSDSSLLPSLIPSVTPSAFHPIHVVYFG